MRWFAAGQSPTGFIAVGQIPTGVIAIGQGATGVIAIGQLARGVICLGQLAIGIVAFGQLACGVSWAGGQLAIGAIRGPVMVGHGLLGRLGLRDFLHGRWDRFEPHAIQGARWARVAVVWLGIVALWWFVGFEPLLDAMTREGGIFRDEPTPRVLR